MTRKHFEMIARAVKSISNDSTRADVALQFAAEFVRDNPRFNRDVFFKACNVGQ